MMRLGLLALMGALLIAGAAQAAPDPAAKPACAPELKPGKGPLPLPAAFDEHDRLGLSAAVYLALSDDTGHANWPEGAIAKAAACETDSFDLDGRHFTIHAGQGEAPLRWANAPGSPSLLFLATGPGLAEAYDWYAAQPRPASMKVVTPAYFLVLVIERMRYVLQAYDGLPSAQALKADMLSGLRCEAKLIATYDPDGEAVTIERPIQAHVAAVLFADLPRRGHGASLRGPDGRFFTASAVGDRMRGSGFACRERFGVYKLRDLTVVNSHDKDLDLMCRLFADDGDWISIFVTRYDAAPPTSAVFDDYLKAMRNAAPPRDEQRNLIAVDGPGKPPFGASWTDANGNGQGTWLARRGRYYLQARATFKDRPGAAQAVMAIFETFAAEVADQDVAIP